MEKQSEDNGCIQEPKSGLFTVSFVNWRGHVKRLTLQPDGQHLIVPLSACVSIGDKIRITAGDAWVVCKNGEAKILRPYVASDTLRLGGLRLEILVKEVTELEEHLAYEALANFHYRGHIIYGRTARLVARTFHPTSGCLTLMTVAFSRERRRFSMNLSECVEGQLCTPQI